MEHAACWCLARNVWDVGRTLSDDVADGVVVVAGMATRTKRAAGGLFIGPGWLGAGVVCYPMRTSGRCTSLSTFILIDCGITSWTKATPILVSEASDSLLVLAGECTACCAFKVSAFHPCPGGKVFVRGQVVSERRMCEWRCVCVAEVRGIDLCVDAVLGHVPEHILATVGGACARVESDGGGPSAAVVE
jgi:hypothetical protein